MSKSFFCLLCLEDKKDLKKFKQKVSKLIDFDKKISNEHKIRSFFGENIDGNFNEFDNYLSQYYSLLLKTCSDIALHLYYINDEGVVAMMLFKNNKYTYNNMTLKVSLEDEDGYEIILNNYTEHIIPTLNTFTPPNNVTVLINDNYCFDNIDC